MEQDSSSLKLKVFWGDVLYDTRLCKPNQSITVGRKPGSTFVLDLEGEHQFPNIPIITLNKDHTAELCFSEHIEGHLRTGKEILSLRNAVQNKRATMNQQGLYSVQLKKGERADFEIGHVSFYLDWVKPAKAYPRDKIDRRKILIWLLALSILGIVVALVNLLQPEPPEKAPERLVTILPRTGGASKAAVGTPQTADGGAQKGEVGKAELAPPKPERPSVTSMLKNANLGSMVSGLANLGSQAPESANSAKQTAAVEQVSTGGSSVEGLKTGGGGKSVGIGRSAGSGRGGFEGTGRLGLSGNSSLDGSGSGGDGAGSGSAAGLDRDLIESIIRRRLDRIRLCYDRQLNFNPKLAGKIAIHFVIGKKGEVVTSKISEDTMRNEAVKGCILKEVNAWSFPPPEGGVMVNVDYPFVFESTSKGR